MTAVTKVIGTCDDCGEPLELVGYDPHHRAQLVRCGCCAPLPEFKPTVAVGICSRCATDVLRRPGRGASCACGSMQIPAAFFEANQC